MSKQMMLISCILAAMVAACTPGLPDEVANAPANDGDGDGFTVDSGDCDDERPDVHPGNDATPAADEVCDGADNDCDGETDEDPASYIAWYPDADNDGDGDRFTTSDEMFMACEQPSGYALQGGDCDDADPTRHLNADEVCDGLDNDCDGAVPVNENDDDADGYRLCDGDCNDTDDEVYPSAQEVCGDGVDQDCDPVNDEIGSTWYRDGDGDGFGTVADSRESCSQPPGFAFASGDCDDANANRFPGNPEICGDTIDQDCSGNDETCECLDADGDGHTDSSCGGDDCDDADTDRFPGNPETCDDDIDQDCTGADEACNCTDPDPDNDGYDMIGCGGDDCDDADSSRYAGAPELCDGKDNACMGSVPTDELDADADGVMACAGDCRDDLADVFPGASENSSALCDDSVDNDCDGFMNAVETDCAPFVDNDGDCFCETAPCVLSLGPSCGVPAGLEGGDCDDTDAERKPGRELGIGEDMKCSDQIDNDCDGLIDALDWDCMDADGDTVPNGVDCILRRDVDGDGVVETISVVSDCAFADAGEPWSRTTGIRQGRPQLGGYDQPLNTTLTDANALITVDGEQVYALSFDTSGITSGSTRHYRYVSATSDNGVDPVDPSTCNWVTTIFREYCEAYDGRELHCHPYLGPVTCLPDFNAGGALQLWVVGFRKELDSTLTPHP